jgi:hypothetical protein
MLATTREILRPAEAGFRMASFQILVAEAWMTVFQIVVADIKSGPPQHEAGAGQLEKRVRLCDLF